LLRYAHSSSARVRARPARAYLGLPPTGARGESRRGLARPPERSSGARPRTQKIQREPLVNFGFGLPKLKDEKLEKGERIDLTKEKMKKTDKNDIKFTKCL